MRKEKRKTYLDSPFTGMTDFTGASLSDIIKQIETWKSYAEESLSNLLISRDDVPAMVRAEWQDDFFSFIGYFTTVFNSYINDFELLLEELPKGVQQRHINMVAQLHKNLERHIRVCRNFKNSFDGRVDAERPLFDTVYYHSSQSMHDFLDLGNVETRLNALSGSKIEGLLSKLFSIFKKGWKVIVAISVILGIISSGIGIYSCTKIESDNFGQANTVASSENNIRSQSYEQLAQIKLGMSVEKVTDLLGSPTITGSLKRNYTIISGGKFVTKAVPEEIEWFNENYYITADYILRLIFDKEKTTVAYSVTPIKENFKPLTPIRINQNWKSDFNKLGDMKFSDIHDWHHLEDVRVLAGADFPGFYSEMYYASKASAGMPVSYIFSLSGSGVWFDMNDDGIPVFDYSMNCDESITHMDCLFSSESFMSWRNAKIPNSFAVIDNFSAKDNRPYLLEYLLNNGITLGYMETTYFVPGINDN
ncbi:MAG: hypothetical protein HZB44_01620 [Actinobacteria bacterium]|nr:hypothetical protein [Actinomycetota bacterium]